MLYLYKMEQGEGYPVLLCIARDFLPCDVYGSNIVVLHKVLSTVLNITWHHQPIRQCELTGLVASSESEDELIALATLEVL